jgi:hypothetical protein
MKIEIPESVRIGHEALRQALTAATREAGTLGATAQRVARLLEPHIRKEEAFALPPLGLLAEIARGDFTHEMAEVLPYTGWLQDNLKNMLAEHRMLRAALEEFLDAARAAGRVEYASFAAQLIEHARLEEEVLYPAAILVGHYVRLRRKQRRREIFGGEDELTVPV